MQVQTFANRGTGREEVWGSGPVVARHRPSGRSSEGGYITLFSEEDIRIHLDDGGVRTSVAEIWTIVQFLRSNGIEVDAQRERQRKLADKLAKSFGPALPAEPNTTIGRARKLRAAREAAAAAGAG